MLAGELLDKRQCVVDAGDMDNDVCVFDYDSPSYCGYCNGCREGHTITYHSERSQ